MNTMPQDVIREAERVSLDVARQVGHSLKGKKGHLEGAGNADSSGGGASPSGEAGGSAERAVNGGGASPSEGDKGTAWGPQGSGAAAASDTVVPVSSQPSSPVSIVPSHAPLEKGGGAKSWR